MNKLKFFDLPVFGYWLPRIWKARLPLNKDGSFVDTGEDDLLDEKGVYYVEPLVFEWFGRGFPLTGSYVYDAGTGLPVDVDFDEAGR